MVKVLGLVIEYPYSKPKTPNSDNEELTDTNYY